MYYTVYEIKNKINGKIYVGYHKTNNLDDGYMGSGKYIKSVIKKYGLEIFEKKILKLCSSEEEMRQLEIEIVNEQFVNREDTYNLKVGGCGGFRKGFVSIKGKQVSKNEFNNNPFFEGVCKGKITVFDSNGKTYQVNKDDDRIKNGELKRCFEKNGLISVFGKNGEKVRVTKEEFNKGGFKSIHTGYVITKDLSGNFFYVKKDDKRLLTGDLVGVTKGINFNESKYKIYDENNNLKFYIINQDFKTFCKNNDLPYGVLIKSYQSNGKKIYQQLGSNKKRIEEKGFIKYSGWYCLKIK